MLDELRDEFVSQFVVEARARIKKALALLPPVGPGGDGSAATIAELMHTTAGESAMIGLTDVADAARAAQAAAKRCLGASSSLALIGCARALRTLALSIDALKLAAPGAEAAADKSTPKNQEGPGRVLVVDDSSLNASLLSDALAAHGVRTVSVKDNLDQALAQLLEFRPHVVMIDAIMPRLDPKVLCQKIREAPANAGIRLLLFTALPDDEAAVQVRALGVDGFVTKAQGISAIVARVRALLPEAEP